ncbi:MAG: O-antigen ligase family protein [Acidobacteriota bacterium]
MIRSVQAACLASSSPNLPHAAGAILLAAFVGGLTVSTNGASFAWVGAGVALAALCWAALTSASVWLLLYFVCVWLAPAFYVNMGNQETPIHAALLPLMLGVLTPLLQLEEVRIRSGESVLPASASFLLCLMISLPFAFWTAGFDVGLQSVQRFILVTQPFVVYAVIRMLGWVPESRSLSGIISVLLCLGGLSALFGVLDFYFRFPFEHPFAEQFIYLDGEKIRRAQGLFYEASSFGNMSAFLLALTFFRIYFRQRVSVTGTVILLGAAGIFTLALFLSYSRGSWLNFLVTAAVFLAIYRHRLFRTGLSLFVLLTAFIGIAYHFSPNVVLNFFDWRVAAPIREILVDPNFMTSGRLETWSRLFTVFADQPELLLFGVGYKTLAYSHYFGQPMIADNAILSSLFETGLVGLLAFLSLNVSLLVTMNRIRRQASAPVKWYASFLFAFWCGETAQMLTGDIFTYWRNMVVFFALMALVLNLHEQTHTCRREK